LGRGGEASATAADARSVGLIGQAPIAENPAAKGFLLDLTGTKGEGR
jgi:hypothetical protein